MERLTITCEIRQAAGKGVARKLRREGKIPGVLYGGDQTVSLVVDPKDIQRVLYSQAGENALFQLNLAGEKARERTVILRELQYDSIGGQLLHVDLNEIAMDVELEVKVPVELLGVPAGADEGGVLTQILNELHVKCLPDRIPDRITLEVSDMDIGDSRHVSDLSIPEGVAVLDDSDATVVNIVAPRVEVLVEEEVEVGEEVEEEEKVEEAAAEEVSEAE